MKRHRGWTRLVIVMFVLGVIGIYRPERAMRVAAGVTAHNLCAAKFIAGLDPDETFKEMVSPTVGALPARMIHYRIDLPAQTVSASFAGLVHATAHHTPGYGCRLEFPDNLPAPVGLPQHASGAAPTALTIASLPAINSAIDNVFTEHQGQPTKNVKAVVVMKDDQVIAKRYAEGIGPDTPLASYSVAKSFTNALLGILVMQGRLSVNQPLNPPEWHAGSDSRSKITIEDLVRMQSGLAAEETGSGFDPSAQMQFLHPDMAGFVATLPAKEAPGLRWEYTSANTLLIDRLLGQLVGGGAAGMRSFAERQLFEPAHISGMTMEFDGQGTFVGSTYLYGPARSYAMFGELFLHDGVLADGRRILPEGWVAWSRRSTLNSSYGAGFWTNDGPSDFAAWRVAHGFPKDGYFASGNLGQRIYIVPSAHLVIARFAYSQGEDFGIRDDMALIDAVVKATRQTSSSTPTS